MAGLEVSSRAGKETLSLRAEILMGKEESFGGSGRSEVFTLKKTLSIFLKLNREFSPLLFSAFFFWERKRSGEGESLELFGVRGLGRFCRM